MYEVSQTTLKFAKARGFDLVWEDSQLCIYEADNDCEWMFSVRKIGDGFFCNGNVYLAQEIKEELPYYMKDEKALRDMLKFVAQEIKK